MRNIAFLVLAAACWGTGTVVSKQAVAEMPALTLLAVQLAVSVGALGVVLLVRGERIPADPAGRALGRLGLLNPGLAYALSLLGLTTITASLAVLLWALEPVLIVLLAAAVLHERLGRAIVLASGVAIVGLFVVVEPSTGGSALGIALTIAGVVACAFYTVLTRRLLLGSDSTFGVVFAQQLHALGLAIGVVTVAAVLGQPALPERLSLAGTMSAIVSGLLYYTLAYSFYISALRAVRASVAAMSFYLIPVFGLAGGFLTGEHLEPSQWAGAGLVVLSVAAVTILSTRPAVQPARIRGLATSSE